MSRMVASASLGLAILLAASLPEASGAGENITPSPTATLQQVSTVQGIQSSIAIPRNVGAFASLQIINDRCVQLSAETPNANNEAELRTSFDDPNTPTVESVPISSLSTDGIFRVGLRDANAANGSGVVTLFLDDALAGSDFVFLSGVDATNRVWEVPLSLFDTVNNSQIKNLSFVLFNGFMPNTTSVLSVYFRGHPFVQYISSLAVGPPYSALAGVPLVVGTAYPPVAVSATLGGGVITSLTSSATNFLAGFVLPNSNSLIQVQIDRGRLSTSECSGISLSAGGLPVARFNVETGNLYKLVIETNLLSGWSTGELYVASTSSTVAVDVPVDPGSSFLRLSSELFPLQNPGTSFSFLARSSSSTQIFGELVDANGVVAPFTFPGSTTLRRFVFATDPEILPEGFVVTNLCILRFSVPKTYRLYANGTAASGANFVNFVTSGSFDIRLLKGVGPVAAPRP